MLVARRERDADRWSWRVALALSLVAPACTPWEAPTPAADERSAECSPESTERLPVITTLVTREHEVTVYASDDGLRFTVAFADGALLGHQLSAREFELGFPALHRRFDATFAGDELWLDASIEGLRTPEAAEPRGPGRGRP